MMKKNWLGAAVGLALTACGSFGPNYQRPEIAVPEAYSEPSGGTAIPDAWWTLFGDPNLDRLVAEALAANQDLAAAAARVEEARAILGITDSARFPQVNANASGGRTKFSNETAQLPPGVDLELDSYRVTASVSYEFDFWGRLRRASEAARAELLASEEGRRNVRLSIAADVATAYFDILTLNRQLAVSRETLGSRGESVRLQQLRFDNGTISELDVAQAQGERAVAEATIPVLERQLRQTENRLGVLLGRIGGSVRGESVPDPAEVKLPEIPEALPSQLLARRPDVLAAEQQLIAANARIGEARAAYFPLISLTGYGGSESLELSNLFASGTNIWQLAAGLVQPIFNAGRTRRQVEAARARERQALAGYVKSVQNAFADVEDALAARATGAAEREALARQVEALERSRKLSGLRYEAGESDYFEVLDAERNLFRAQLDLASARRGELVGAVALFQALGGGWEETAPPPQAPVP